VASGRGTRPRPARPVQALPNAPAAPRRRPARRILRSGVGIRRLGGWAEDYPEALALCLAVELRDQGARSSARRMLQRSFDRKMDRPTKTAGAVQCGRAFRARADSILPGSDRLSGEVTPVTGRALPSRCPVTNPSQISRMRKQSAAKNFIPCCGSGFCSSKEASPIYGEPGSIRILVPPDWPKSAYRYPAASAPCYLP